MFGRFKIAAKAPKPKSPSPQLFYGVAFGVFVFWQKCLVTDYLIDIFPNTLIETRPACHQGPAKPGIEFNQIIYYFYIYLNKKVVVIQFGSGCASSIKLVWLQHSFLALTYEKLPVSQPPDGLVFYR